MPEPPLKVFISSVMSAGYLAEKRDAIRKAIDALPIASPWDFATAPAEPSSPMTVAIREVNNCDMFVILVHNRHTPNVQAELDAAFDKNKPVFAFVQRLGAEDSTPERQDILEQLSSRKYAEFTTLGDLAREVTTALTDELVRGYRDRYRSHLDDTDLSNLINTEESDPIPSTSTILQQATSADSEDIANLLAELIQWYPHIKDWIPKALSDLRGIQLVRFDDSIAGIAIARDKEPHIRKYSTLYVTANSRGSAIGPRLVREVVKSAVNDKVRKAFVTFAAELEPRIRLVLAQSGFVVEGVSAGRYRLGKGEWVMGKTFVYETITPEDFTDFVKQRLVIEAGGTVILESTSHIHANLPSTSLTGGLNRHSLDIYVSTDTDPALEYETIRAEREDNNWLFASMLGRPADTANNLHGASNWIDGTDILSRFYPVDLQAPEHDCIVVSIRPGFADQLIPSSTRPSMLPPSRLQLRPDNVYYRTADRYQTINRGARIFFYVTDPESAIRGTAIITDYTIGTPKDCFALYGTKGVFSYDDIVDHVGERGEVLAISFDWYEEFARPVPLTEIRQIYSGFNPISANVISSTIAHAVMQRGNNARGN